MNPKTAYFEAKKLCGRYVEGEGVLVRPYNFKLKKFVKDRSEYVDNMFIWGIAYLRNILLGRVYSGVVEDYKSKLEKQLIKHFNSNSVYNYGSTIGGLSEVLHNMMIVGGMNGDITAKYYLENSQKKPELYRGDYLTKPMMVHNILLTKGLEVDTEFVIKECYRMGVVVNKSLVSRVRNGLHKKIGGF